MVVELDQATYRHLIVLILQFLYEENYNSTLHSLERESKVFFNMRYFLETVESGAFEESDKYLSAFTMSSDNAYSQMLFNELQRQRDSRASARVTGLLTSDANVRGNKFQNDQLISLVQQNPVLQDKLFFPTLNKSGLSSIINLVCLNTRKEPGMLKEAVLFLIYQFLDEESFHETSLELEQEAAIFFNMKHFEKLLFNSEWDKANKYLSAFTSLDDNWQSFLMFYGITMQKFFEAIPWNDDTSNMYVTNARTRLKKNFKSLVLENQSLRDKLKFQCMDKSRLLTLVKHVMDWFTACCRNARFNGDRTLSLEGIPEVPCVYHAQPNSTNRLCETTPSATDHESIHQNSLQVQWHIIETDSLFLSFLVTKENGETTSISGSSLEE